MPQGKAKSIKIQVFQEQLIFFLKRKKVKNWETAQEVLGWYIEWHNNQINRDLNEYSGKCFQAGSVQGDQRC